MNKLMMVRSGLLAGFVLLRILSPQIAVAATTAQAELLRAAMALEGADSDSAASIEAIRRRPAISEVIR
jgi:hypothetical protein